MSHGLLKTEKFTPRLERRANWLRASFRQYHFEVTAPFRTAEAQGSGQTLYCIARFVKTRVVNPQLELNERPDPFNVVQRAFDIVPIVLHMEYATLLTYSCHGLEP